MIHAPLTLKEQWRKKRAIKREKKRCRALYPDWRDDEFNILHNKFIWGFTSGCSRTPSFYTWEDFYIYYNRAEYKYYFHVDTGIYRYLDQEAARYEVERLAQIEKAFREYLIENKIPIEINICFCDLEDLGAYSLAELYTKFYIFYKGYEKVILN